MKEDPLALLLALNCVLVLYSIHADCARSCPIKLAHREAIAAALHHSPAASLVASDAAVTIVEQIVGNQERCLQVLFFLETLAEPPDEVDSAAEAPAS